MINTETEAAFTYWEKSNIQNIKAETDVRGNKKMMCVYET